MALSKAVVWKAVAVGVVFVVVAALFSVWVAVALVGVLVGVVAQRRLGGTKNRDSK